MSPYSTKKYMLREINPDNQADIETITQMHLDLFPWAPIAHLGRIFLQRFCYSLLVKDDLVKVALYEVNDQPAGFIAYTAYSTTFHRTAVKKHWLYAAYVILISILNDPRVILRIFKAIRLMFSRRSEIVLGSDLSAEILAIGVYPEFRTPQFIYRTGLRISHELFGKAVTYFKSLGLSKMRLVVDSFNKPTLIFYHSLGGRFEKYERAGDPMAQIWFDFENISV